MATKTSETRRLSDDDLVRLLELAKSSDKQETKTKRALDFFSKELKH
jgi:hypothetical protein